MVLKLLKSSGWECVLQLFMYTIRNISKYLRG